MRFLVDADLPRAVAALLQSLGHDAVDVRDVGMGAARDEEVAAYARKQQRCLLTGDFGFADIRDYPPKDYAGMAVLVLPESATRASILRLVSTFAAQHEVLESLPGKLAIIDAGRIRLRSS